MRYSDLTEAEKAELWRAVAGHLLIWLVIFLGIFLLQWWGGASHVSVYDPQALEEYRAIWEGNR
jgi:type II secretory pathway component PulL